ncbi:MAG: hypothetical protein A3J74_02975 [Elusimicrobia bacterium RIFCSPHIGHO2_02_FULL_57_9]|nr:MAG: hypothetical protein A3J74_02975 [Elusimicrobia bacterium RIFCSPHIGHO2_02_FULL_57_9]
MRSNKKAAFEIINEAAREEQARRQQEQQEAEKKEFENSFKKPLKPEISDKTRMRGNRGAKLTLVEYSDFQCPYCSRGYQTVEELRKKYGASLRFVYKNLPLNFHPQAMPAAQYFEAASLQSPEKAWAFHDKLFENQAKLGEPFYKETAKALGLDLARLEKDAQSPAVKDKIEADLAEAKKFGFDGTPAFLINGIPVRGAYPVEHFESIITKLDKK